ncbi:MULTISPECIES: homoprotocatechuate degradation operon regulator HpaR [Chelativorans]|jgi:homoprotocatechuate degradation regulator HpaR|uniref:Transcriptional regulator, MarR family n=1 Tax=Chelativorans sp. (strain BNC1) TaxID=266779 RepID=Q11FH8_CHESB|nr:MULTISPECIES: homoprotocatechuate degradation operon regulator HpaR [Chelativorans]
MKKQEIKDGFGLYTTRRTLPMALLRAREVVMERFRPLLGDYGLTEQQWRVLRVLNEVDEMDATKLARQASVLLPSLTRIIKLLVSRGLIETRKDPEDSRRALARLTSEGRNLIFGVAPDSVKIYRQIEALYGADRLSHLLDELELLINALETEA